VREVLKRSYLRLLERQCDGFLTIGTHNRAFYRHFGVPEAKLFSMPYAVDNRSIQSCVQEARGQREQLRSELGLAVGRPVVLFAAKLVARKRPLDLLEAMLRIGANPQARNPYAQRRRAVGDGRERSDERRHGDPRE
jgi:hypothetical protein